MSAARAVTLYTRRACGLCEEAQALLEALAGEIGFALELVDIDTAGDAALRLRYDEAVPVVAVGGEEIARAPIGGAALEERLRARYR